MNRVELAADDGIESVVIGARVDGELHILAEREPPASASVEGALVESEDPDESDSVRNVM